MFSRKHSHYDHHEASFIRYRARCDPPNRGQVEVDDPDVACACGTAHLIHQAQFSVIDWNVRQNPGVPSSVKGRRREGEPDNQAAEHRKSARFKYASSPAIIVVGGSRHTRVVKQRLRDDVMSSSDPLDSIWILHDPCWAPCDSATGNRDITPIGRT